jgi:hypothetical protein
LAHGGKWNETSEALIKVRLVCGDCYEEIKSKNALDTGTTNPGTDGTDPISFG